MSAAWIAMTNNVSFPRVGMFAFSLLIRFSLTGTTSCIWVSDIPNSFSVSPLECCTAYVSFICILSRFSFCYYWRVLLLQRLVYAVKDLAWSSRIWSRGDKHISAYAHIVRQGVELYRRKWVRHLIVHVMYSLSDVRMIKLMRSRGTHLHTWSFTGQLSNQYTDTADRFSHLSICSWPFPRFCSCSTFLKFLFRQSSHHNRGLPWCLKLPCFNVSALFLSQIFHSPSLHALYTSYSPNPATLAYF